MSGGGGGSNDTTTVQKADPWGGQQPYLSYGFQQAQKNYESGGPNYYGSSTVADFSPQTQQALDSISGRAQAGSDVTRAAQAESAKTLSGGYLNNNPYLDSMWDQGAGDIQSRIGAQFGSAGRTGSGVNQQVLSRELANGYNNLYGQNYQAERGRQMQTMALAPQTSQLDYADLDRMASVGGTYDQQAQNKLDDQVNRFNFNENRPQQNLQNYIAAIQGNYGGATTTTQEGGGTNRAAGILGGGLAGSQIGAGIGDGYGGWGALGGALLGAFA